MHDWILTVEFDPGSSEEYPEGEALACYCYVLNDWAVDEEDLEPEELVLKGASITMRADVLGYLESTLRWVTRNSVPVRMELKRNGPR